MAAPRIHKKPEIEDYEGSEVCVLPLQQLVAADFNPPSRTTPTAMHNLEELIRAHGVLCPIHVIQCAEDDKYLIVDGHRRFALATKLGHANIKCVVHRCEMSCAASLWSALNSGSRKLTSYEWMVAWYCNNGIAVPSSIMGRIRQAEEIFGKPMGVKWLIDQNVSPAVVVPLLKLHTVCSSKASLSPVPSKRIVGQWMIRHRTIGFVQSLFAHNGAVISLAILRKVLSRIRNDKPIIITDLVSRKAEATKGQTP